MDKYKDMTLPELEAAFATESARFATLTAKDVPNVSDMEEAEALAANLSEGGALHDTLKKAKAFSSLKGRTFAVEDPKPAEQPKASDPAPASTGPAEQNPKVVTEVPVEEQARTDAEGTHNTDAPAEQARVNHVETIQDPVDPAQVAPGQVVGPDGQGVAIQQSSAVQALAARQERPDLPAHRRKGTARIQAASGLSDFSHGQGMSGLLDVARAVESSVKSFPTWAPPTGALAEMGQAGETKLSKFGTAVIDLGIPEDLIVDENTMSQQMQADVLDRAADEQTLPGGSLTAAGGWCAPSETVYDLTIDATNDGMLSHPEIGVRRGGLRWAVSPNFSAFYANPGFKYTEAQLIAGVTKPCVTIPCPSFDEARLQVEGLCIKVDIVSEVGYPEHIRNYVDGTLLAHQHWMNATKIAAMVTIAGAARVFTGMGSSVDDTLAAMELVANQERQRYRLRMNQTLEAVFPFWVKDMFKADLRRRNNQQDPVSDQQLMALFRAAKINPQFVYDWQELALVDDAATTTVNESLTYPTTFNTLMYPAGTFIFGTAPVINLSSVYDAASLAANQYTGLFTEQGWLVAKRKFGANLLTIPVCNGGRRGVLDMTCGTGRV